MKIVITGGAGFIGSNAAAYFLNKGYEVLVFDNLSRKGTKKNLDWIRSLRGKLKVIIGDIRNSEDLKLLKNHIANADAILHLAAQVAVTSSVTNPREDFDINALGTFNILELMRTTSSKAKIIYSSTNKVYGGMEKIGISKKLTRYEYELLPEGVSEGQALDFHSPYGCSKGAADQYVHDYGRIYDLDSVVFRQSCIYGPRQFGVEDQGWVAWFIIALSLGKTLTIYGDGRQVRDLLYIDDLISAYDQAITYKKETRGKIYNIGGGARNTMSVWTEFGPILEKLFKRTITPTFADWRPGDQPVFVSNISKAKKEFGWAPTVSVEEGIKRLYTWITANKELFLAFQ